MARSFVLLNVIWSSGSVQGADDPNVFYARAVTLCDSLAHIEVRCGGLLNRRAGLLRFGDNFVRFRVRNRAATNRDEAEDQPFKLNREALRGDRPGLGSGQLFTDDINQLPA